MMMREGLASVAGLLMTYDLSALLAYTPCSRQGLTGFASQPQLPWV